LTGVEGVLSPFNAGVLEVEGVGVVEVDEVVVEVERGELVELAELGFDVEETVSVPGADEVAELD